MRTSVLTAISAALLISLTAPPVDAASSSVPTAGAQAKKTKAIKARLKPLRDAITDLTETFGGRYPKGREFLGRLAAIERAEAAGRRMNDELNALRREALIANPLVSGHPIAFISRRQYKGDHHNTATMFQTNEINTRSFQGPAELKTIEFAAGGKVATLGKVPNGVARDPEVSLDGRKISFSMRHDIKDDYHIYEIDADGTGLRQITFGPGVSDIDPLYVPDGTIVFSSTREPKYCMCNRHIMCNLFKMNADGSNIHQIGHSTLHEGHGSLMAAGRILYDRWEYVDRNFGDAQGLWTVNPDGTNHAVYWANNTPSPGAVLDARVIPGTEKLISTFSSCHDRPWGALAIVARRLGIDGKPPVIRTWPAGAINMVMRGNYDTFRRVNPKYEDPYPLSERYFLCSRRVRGEQMGIFLLDTFGHELLLYVEGHGCYDPMPVRPRPAPTDIPTRTDLAEKQGYFYLANAYSGTHMKLVKPGSVKYLRVVQSPEKRSWTGPAWSGSGTQAPGMAWDDFNNKRILGTVPVEEDGSVFFAVPADKFVYFQILDEKGMMIQSMRSGTMIRPGERTGCIGCHENRLTAMPHQTMPLAMRKPPQKLTPWYGPPRLYNYTAEVQPVFDKHCIECHDYGKPGAKKLILAGDTGNAFNASYVALRGSGYVMVPGAGPASFIPPYGWGSHRSKLAQVLLKGHNKVKLDKESFDRIVTWIDINAPYYPSYASAYPRNRYGRSPLNGGQMKRLGQLVGINLNDQKSEMRVQQVSFTRPEKSPCLARFKDKNDRNYKEALAIIQAGKAQLAKRPRMDMPGARLVGIDVEREKKYQRLLKAEAEARRAIVEGKKNLEKNPGGH